MQNVSLKSVLSKFAGKLAEGAVEILEEGGINVDAGALAHRNGGTQLPAAKPGDAIDTQGEEAPAAPVKAEVTLENGKKIKTEVKRDGTQYYAVINGKWRAVARAQGGGYRARKKTQVDPETHSWKPQDIQYMKHLSTTEPRKMSDVGKAMKLDKVNRLIHSLRVAVQSGLVRTSETGGQLLTEKGAEFLAQLEPPAAQEAPAAAKAETASEAPAAARPQHKPAAKAASGKK